ncbi:ATP-binding protein [Tumebacillus sp. DT12]|uniref:ATP-binding protein n=1 Tax=Tumebacillus lacus TaxID=2995335 RepID=A0ABT3X3H1_9BACL|nr:AFG1/ZapE family ATPase [Tumebacillus lacus]MCX7571439.1 ATP-binding protein [Tumebacillus lacus]
MQHIGSTLNFGARFKEQQSAYTPDYFRERLPQVRTLGVDDQTIRAGAILLLDLLKQERVCGSCKGFDQCGKEGDAKGHYDMLDVYNGQLTVRTTHCNEYLKFVERREIDNLKEFSEKTQEDKRYRFDNYPVEQARKHPKLYAAAMEFAEAFTTGRQNLSDAQKGLYIFGPPGVGKTHLMLAICNRLDDRKVPNIFVRADSIFDKLRMSVASGKEMETVIEKYCTVPVLAIDEFAQERANEFTLDKMFRIINYRFSNQLPTLFTSNYEPPAVYRPFQEQSKTVDAMISRIIQMTKIGRLSGKDARLSHMEILDN